MLKLIPSLRELSHCDVLQRVNQFPSFIAIMNSGYEQLDRVINNSTDT